MPSVKEAASNKVGNQAQKAHGAGARAAKSRGKGEGKGQWHWNQWSGTWNYQGGSSSWGDDEMQSMSNWSASNW